VQASFYKKNIDKKTKTGSIRADFEKYNTNNFIFPYISQQLSCHFSA